jgi:formylglycine-generating enzyme
VSSRVAWWIAIGAAAAAVVAVTVVAARKSPMTTSRCPPGFTPLQARCCAEGQTENAGRCVGTPSACPAGFEATEQGCAVQPRRVSVPPGRLNLGPGDWEAQGVVTPREIVVAEPFLVDAFEVTVAQWNRCVAAGSCFTVFEDEPARPVRQVSYAEASRYCAWEGGALLSDDEWVFVAAGAQARRYPWGDTGAVCARATWGRAHGPCSRSGLGPDWTGSHPGDATPEGVFDLAGNVSEWVRGPNGASTRGGNWSSGFAAELRTWHSIEREASERRDDVGVRCRYAVGGAASERTR